MFYSWVYSLEGKCSKFGLYLNSATKYIKKHFPGPMQPEEVRNTFASFLLS